MLARFRSRRFVVFAFIAVLPLAACSDDEAVDEHEEEPAFLELTIGAQMVRLDETGDIVAGGAPVLQAGQNVAVTARFLADDLDVLEFDSDEYELRGTSASTSTVTWTSGGPFNGTLNAVAVGNTAVQFTLYHLAENHPDWGPHGLPVTVTNP